MKLRDNFPRTHEEAKIFDVEILDKSTVFKIFESEDTLNGVKVIVKEVNIFLEYNGYESINISKFIENDFSFESENNLVSLSKHGYLIAFVLFIAYEK